MNEPLKLLVVDDEEDVLAELADTLEYAGYDVTGASGVERALKELREQPDIAIVITDLRMPGRGGLELIASARAEFPSERDLEFVILTGHGGLEDAITAMQETVLDFLTKPIDQRRLLQVVMRAEELISLRRVKRHFDQGLEADVRAKTLEIRSLLNKLQGAYAEALDCLAVAAEYKDPETGNHIRRIGEYSAHIARRLGMSRERVQMLELAAPLHDAGKLGIPEAILLKPGKLDRGEVEVMMTHPEIGHRILSRSNHPTMVCAATIAWCHHERWDGTGYPRGLVGEQIPIEARIVALIDVYDALRSKRPYKEAFSHEKTVSIILEGDGRTMPGHFAPELITLFREIHLEADEIFTRLAD